MLVRERESGPGEKQVPFSTFSRPGREVAWWGKQTYKTCAKTSLSAGERWREDSLEGWEVKGRLLGKADVEKGHWKLRENSPGRKGGTGRCGGYREARSHSDGGLGDSVIIRWSVWGRGQEKDRTKSQARTRASEHTGTEEQPLPAVRRWTVLKNFLTYQIFSVFKSHTSSL